MSNTHDQDPPDSIQYAIVITPERAHELDWNRAMARLSGSRSMVSLLIASPRGVNVIVSPTPVNKAPREISVPSMSSMQTHSERVSDAIFEQIYKGQAAAPHLRKTRIDLLVNQEVVDQVTRRIRNESGVSGISISSRTVSADTPTPAVVVEFVSRITHSSASSAPVFLQLEYGKDQERSAPQSKPEPSEEVARLDRSSPLGRKAVALFGLPIILGAVFILVANPFGVPAQGDRLSALGDPLLQPLYAVAATFINGIYNGFLFRAKTIALYRSSSAQTAIYFIELVLVSTVQSMLFLIGPIFYSCMVDSADIVLSLGSIFPYILTLLLFCLTTVFIFANRLVTILGLYGLATFGWSCLSIFFSWRELWYYLSSVWTERSAGQVRYTYNIGTDFSSSFISDIFRIFVVELNPYFYSWQATVNATTISSEFNFYEGAFVRFFAFGGAPNPSLALLVVVTGLTMMLLADIRRGRAIESSNTPRKQ